MALCRTAFEYSSPKLSFLKFRFICILCTPFYVLYLFCKPPSALQGRKGAGKYFQ